VASQRSFSIHFSPNLLFPVVSFPLFLFDRYLSFVSLHRFFTIAVMAAIGFVSRPGRGSHFTISRIFLLFVSLLSILPSVLSAPAPSDPKPFSFEEALRQAEPNPPVGIKTSFSAQERFHSNGTGAHGGSGRTITPDQFFTRGFDVLHRQYSRIPGSSYSASQVSSELQKLISKKGRRVQVLWLDNSATAGDVLTNASILQKLLEMPSVFDVTAVFLRKSWDFLPADFQNQVKKVSTVHSTAAGFIADGKNLVRNSRMDLVVRSDLAQAESASEQQDNIAFQRWVMSEGERQDMHVVSLLAEVNQQRVDRGFHDLEPNSVLTIGSDPRIWNNPSPQSVGALMLGFFDALSAGGKSPNKQNMRVVQDFVDQARRDDRKVLYLGFGMDHRPNEASSSVVSEPIAKFLDMYNQRRGSPDQVPLRFIVFHNTPNTRHKQPYLDEMKILHIWYGQLPMKWLYEQVQAGVIHAGAGTTRNAVAAQMPVIPMTMYANDQVAYRDFLTSYGVGLPGPEWRPDLGSGSWSSSDTKQLYNLVQKMFQPSSRSSEPRYRTMRQGYQSRTLNSVFDSPRGTKLTVEALLRLALARLSKWSRGS
jgi:hypothetical protein